MLSFYYFVMLYKTSKTEVSVLQKNCRNKWHREFHHGRLSTQPYLESPKYFIIK